MRGRSVAWFVLGFASGAALAVTLWLSHAHAPPAAEAERAAPEAPAAIEPPSPRLLIPVEGVPPEELIDSYSQARAEGREHEAIDIPAPRGTPVVAAVEGPVVKLFDSKDGGLTVYQFDSAREWCYYYAHLDRYEPGLREGMLLRRGDRLGYVGSTGNASPDNPHLHFAIFRLGPGKRWWEGIPVNPYPLLTEEPRPPR